MKPNTIELFPDGRIGAYEMPVPIEDGFVSDHLEAIEAAKRDAVYFKGYQDESLQVGKPYPVPDGYEIKIEQTLGYHRGASIEYYAILVPKGKAKQKQHLIDMMKEDEKNGMYELPKQSIEEAAEDYSIDFNNRSWAKMSFIAGAKWMEALAQAYGDYREREKGAVALMTFNKWYKQFISHEKE